MSINGRPTASSTGYPQEDFIPSTQFVVPLERRTTPTRASTRAAAAPLLITAEERNRGPYSLARNVVTPVGRGSEALRLMSLATSREHGVFQFDESQGWTYKDVGSTGGSTINGVAVTPSVRVPLFNGDRLGFGAAVETMGEDGPEYWVVSNVGRERPALPPPFPAHEDNYAKAIIDALKEGFKDANAALDRRDFDSLWSTAGRVVNRLKDASGTFG